MDNNELEQKINELTSRIAQLEAASVTEVTSSSIFGPLDDLTAKTIKNFISDEIMDIVWNSYFYYFTGFASPDEFTTTGSTVIFDGGGVLLGTAATLDTSASLYRDLALMESVNFSRESRIRTRIRLGSDITDQRIEIGIGSIAAPNIDNDGYGFYIEDNALFGFAQSDFSSRSSLRLKTVSSSTTYALDARYYPNGRVDFYVDNKLLGSVGTNLPVGIDTSVQFFGAVITTQEGVAKSMFIHSFEFIQDREF